MKVICAGMPKTGTKSMRAALEQLGYIVYDFVENFEYFEKEYERIFENGWTKEDFRQMYNEVDAVCDVPTFYFWEDILEAFPDAKVILTVRDNDDIWFRSMKKQLEKFTAGNFYFLSLCSKTWRCFVRYATEVCHEAFSPPRFHDLRSNKFNISKIKYKQSYRRHNAYVMNTCPKEQLLVFNCKEGWQPLCQFLGKDAPDGPFSHENRDSALADTIWLSPTFKRIQRELTITPIAFTTLGIFTSISLAKIISSLWRK